MIPEDLMAMLGGGGGGAPAAPAGPIPPELAAMFGGGEEAGPPSIVDGAPGGGEDPLIGAIDLIQQAIDAEADQEDIQIMLQCQTKLQQILAKNQADSDAALGGKVSPKAIRKAAGGGAGPAGY